MVLHAFNCRIANFEISLQVLKLLFALIFKVCQMVNLNRTWRSCFSVFSFICENLIERYNSFVIILLISEIKAKTPSTFASGALHGHGRGKFDKLFRFFAHESKLLLIV